MARLNPGEGMDRDGGLGGVSGQIVDVIIDHLDGEEMLADAGVSLMMLDAGLLIKAEADAVGEGDGMVDAEDSTGLNEGRLGAQDKGW